MDRIAWKPGIYIRGIGSFDLTLEEVRECIGKSPQVSPKVKEFFAFSSKKNLK